jgi:nitrous oxidase accessory protein
MAGSGGAAGIGIGLKESGNVIATRNVLVRDTTGIYIDTSPLQNDDENRFEGNAIRMSGTAVLFHGRATRNHFIDNSFRDNLTQVESRGGTTALDAEWRGNDFDDYAGYDFDGDGYGDVPYELRSMTANLISRYPGLAYFRGGLALFAVDAVNHVVPRAELLDAARALAREVSQCAPLSVMLTRQAIYQGLENTFEAQVRFEGYTLDHLYRTADHAEAVAAFRDKRPPRFSGR